MNKGRTLGKRERTSIPEELKARLLVESRHICNVCWESKEVQIHHIQPVAKRGDNSEDNLIVVCLNCHSEVHTHKDMSRNLSPSVLRLYKETWVDLVQRYPLLPKDLAEDENDLKLIRAILKEGDRRALYFPFDYENTRNMFQSLDHFRVFIQSSGYRLLRNQLAKEHIFQIYKALVELEPLRPDQASGNPCLLGVYDKASLDWLQLKRKAICFHLNELAELVGTGGPFIREDEFQRVASGMPVPRTVPAKHPCFGYYSKDKSECRRCKVRAECRIASH